MHLNDSSVAETARETAADQGARGFPAIAYHVVLNPLFDEIAWCGGFESIRWHANGTERHPLYGVGMNNVRGIGLLVAGDYSQVDPDAKILALVQRTIAWIRSQFPQKLAVRGHKNVSPTICPGNGWPWLGLA